LAAILTEISPAVIGGWIQKVYQPTADVVLVEIRTPGATRVLLLSTAPDTARLHLVETKLPNPSTPPAFCQYLRAHLQGARIDTVVQVPGDRIAKIGLTARKGPRTLIAQLTGRHADLLLLDEADRILAELHTKADRLGHVYALPQGQHADSETSTFHPPPDMDTSNPFPLSMYLERHFREHEQTSALAQAKAARLAVLKKAIAKGTRRAEALRSDLDKAERFREYGRYGELLKGMMGSLTKGQTVVTVIDYFDPNLPELVLPLDPSKTPQGNMEDYFKKHQKHLAATRAIQPRIERTEQEVQALIRERDAIRDDSWTATPTVGATSLTPTTANKTRRTKPSATDSSGPQRRGPFRRFHSADGCPIFVGKNAKENDELTFRFAHSEDLWLHARGVPGSHVVVRLDKGAEPTPDTLKDAATLALLYSDLKKSGRGDVIYTRRKHVRKLKGQPLGTVSVTQDKSMFVTLDKARLEALKLRAEQGQ
jgi:predicted ribosome quality control (RQC) complex YloA/Tae2 family protein